MSKGKTNVSHVIGSFCNVCSLTYALWCAITWEGDKHCLISFMRCAFIASESYEPKVCPNSRTLFPWHISPNLFLCSTCRYIDWQIIWSKYGYFAIKDLWQPCLMDILAIVFPILVFRCDCWLDFGNSNKIFFPFLLMDVSWTSFHFRFCCVDRRSLCMFVGRTLVLFLGPKLQENLDNNDIGNEDYICWLIATMKNEEKNIIIYWQN